MNCILQNDCLLHNIINLLRRGINRSKNVNIIQLTNVKICYCHHDGVVYLDTRQRSVHSSVYVYICGIRQITRFVQNNVLFHYDVPVLGNTTLR